MSRLRPILMAILGSLIVAIANDPLSGRIPEHGAFLELTIPEWVMIIWLPLAPILFGKTDAPWRWWLYYGLISFVFLWPSSKWFLLTQYHSGRRPWMPASNIELKLTGVIMCFALVPVLAALIRRRNNDHANNTSEGICQPADGLPKSST